MSDTFPRTTHNKPLKFVPLRSTGRELRSRRLAERVCRAWHVTREVEVLLPGIRRAEG